MEKDTRPLCAPSMGHDWTIVAVDGGQLVWACRRCPMINETVRLTPRKEPPK